MRPQPLPATFYIENRKRLVAKLKPNSVAVFHSNFQMPTNADGTLPFVQNSDLFYLTGINQEKTVLLLFPSATNPNLREILFVRYADESVLTWEGHKYSKVQASALSGVETVMWYGEFEKVFKNLVFDAEYIYLNSNEHKRADSDIKNKDDQFVEWCKAQFPLHGLSRLAPLMHQLRIEKQEYEIDRIKAACVITKSGFERVAKFVKPDVFEYEIQAEFAHEFIRLGSKGFAYEPIIASGADSCVLHYITNHKKCQNGDLILLDVAAEYDNYKSDLTRVLPVSGSFTGRQKAVYQSVLNMFRYAVSFMKPDASFEDYNKAVAEKAEEELVNLGLIKVEELKGQNKNKPLYKKYFMHGVSHFLGLDVHDVGSMSGQMKSGMVLTCEPGIYIREEGIGIRLENNILITKDGNKDLMSDIPIEMEEIESLMRKNVS
jgi:Xaa-Pro aminopeptidase